MLPDENMISPVEHGCAYLQEWLSALSDGNLAGIPRWYTDIHAATCPYCRVALKELRELHGTLARLEAVDAADAPADWNAPTPDAGEVPALDFLSPERRAAVFAAWDAIDDEIENEGAATGSRLSD